MDTLPTSSTLPSQDSTAINDDTLPHLDILASTDTQQIEGPTNEEAAVTPHICRGSNRNGVCPCSTYTYKPGPKRFLTYGAHGVRPRNFARALLMEVEENGDGGLTNSARDGVGVEYESGGESGDEGGGGEDGGGLKRGAHGNDGSGSEGEAALGDSLPSPPTDLPPPKVKLTPSARRNANKKKCKLLKGVRLAAKALAAERLEAARGAWVDDSSSSSTTNADNINASPLTHLSNSCALGLSMWRTQKD